MNHQPDTTGKEHPPHRDKIHPWYDDIPQIDEKLHSLETLHQLVNARQAAYQQDKKPLQEIILFSRFILTTDGRCLIFDSYPSPKTPSVPEVLSMETFNRLSGRELENTTPANIPLPGMECAYCRKQWDIDSCHDFTSGQMEIHTRPLGNFKGRSFGDIQLLFERERTAIYQLLYVIDDVTWNHYDGGGTQAGYIIKPGDYGRVTVIRCYHYGCLGMMQEYDQHWFTAEKPCLGNDPIGRVA